MALEQIEQIEQIFWFFFPIRKIHNNQKLMMLHYYYRIFILTFLILLGMNSDGVLGNPESKINMYY